MEATDGVREIFSHEPEEALSSAGAPEVIGPRLASSPPRHCYTASKHDLLCFAGTTGRVRLFSGSRSDASGRA